MASRSNNQRENPFNANRRERVIYGSSEIAFVLVRFDYVARMIIHANHGMM